MAVFDSVTEDIAEGAEEGFKGAVRGGVLGYFILPVVVGLAVIGAAAFGLFNPTTIMSGITSNGVGATAMLATGAAAATAAVAYPVNMAIAYITGLVGLGFGLKRGIEEQDQAQHSSVIKLTPEQQVHITSANFSQAHETSLTHSAQASKTAPGSRIDAHDAHLAERVNAIVRHHEPGIA